MEEGVVAQFEPCAANNVQEQSGEKNCNDTKADKRNEHGRFETFDCSSHCI